MTITIISVGSKPKREIQVLIDDFIKRLPRHIHVSWQFVKHGSGDPRSSVETESESIMRIVPKNTTILLLDESGKNLSSPELSKVMFETGSNMTFIIGGAYGVSQTIASKAAVTISLGKLVYPHEIVRLMLAEQIYRAHTIHVGHPYHHGSSLHSRITKKES